MMFGNCDCGRMHYFWEWRPSDGNGWGFRHKLAWRLMTFYMPAPSARQDGPVPVLQPVQLTFAL